MKSLSEMSESLLQKSRLTRREIAIGFIALSLGGMLGAQIERPDASLPLKPENGEAQSTINIEWLPATVKRWKSEIEKQSSEYGIDPNLPAIIMTIESGGDPNANSGQAIGLMQIAPGTAGDIAHKFVHTPVDKYDLKNPNTSIEFGVAYIAHLIHDFGDSNQGPSWDKTVGLVAAGYNGGEEGGAKPYRDSGLAGLIGNQQTHDYVRYVTTMWDERHDDKSFALRYWLDQGNGQALITNAKKYKKP